mmetsp:Transcript_38374/g.56538  ORF Transcript_38374/g.56538 Transcript_38374/m.56538 type:complete len:81 (-) Transcript_38374:278-520(-)
MPCSNINSKDGNMEKNKLHRMILLRPLVSLILPMRELVMNELKFKSRDAIETADCASTAPDEQEGGSVSRVKDEQGIAPS